MDLLTRQLARGARPRITVNAIAPGPFPTDMISGVPLPTTAESTALRRWGRQDDAAGMAIFLASRAGSFVTGAILALDGGMYSVGSYWSSATGAGGSTRRRVARTSPERALTRSSRMVQPVYYLPTDR